MKIFLLILASLVLLPARAQLKKHSVAAEGGGAIVLHTLSKDSLVAPKRQGKITVGSDTYINVYFLFSFHNPSFKCKVGVGYADRLFSLHKNSFGDFITSFFLFDSYRRDSFSLRSIQVYNRYLNIPVGISYRLSQGKRKVCEAYAGIQVNSNILCSSKATAKFDSTYKIPTILEKQAVEKKYAQTSDKCFVTLLPRMDLNFDVYKGIGLDVSLFPFIFNLNSSNKKLISGSFGFTGLMGIHYDF